MAKKYHLKGRTHGNGIYCYNLRLLLLTIEEKGRYSLPFCKSLTSLLHFITLRLILLLW